MPPPWSQKKSPSGAAPEGQKSLVRSVPSQRAEWRDDYDDDRKDEGGNKVSAFAGKDHEFAARSARDSVRVNRGNVLPAPQKLCSFCRNGPGPPS